MLELRSGQFLTTTSARCDWPAVRITETAYARGQRLPPHAHEGVYLVVMTRGMLRETARGRDHDLGRGEIVFTSDGATHHDVACAADTRCLNIELRDDVASWLGRRSAGPTESLIYTRVGPAIGAVGRLQLALRDPNAQLAVEEAVTELFSAVCSESPRRDGFHWLRRTLDHLHATFRSGVRLDDVVSVAGVHRTHLCRSFRAATGCTMGEYVRRLRADRAYQRIADDAATLAAIAADCGYADQSHMTREVRRRYGRGPSAVRRGSC